MTTMLRAALLVFAFSLSLTGSTFSFRGTFSTDDQIKLFYFTIDANSTVDLQSLAYGGGTNAAGVPIAAGGFDSFFTYYAADGTQIGTVDDGVCGRDPVRIRNGACLDAYAAVFLTAGRYTLALTESGNAPNGDLTDGFSQQGNRYFTCTQGFCDSLGGQDNGRYAVDLLNVSSATAVPEPATLLLVGVFVLRLCLHRITSKSKDFMARLLVIGSALVLGAFAQTVPLTQDAYVVPFSPINYGSATNLNVGGNNGAHGLIQFDLNRLPTGTTDTNIMKATLTLFVGKVGNPGTVNVSVANGPWTETAVNGNNAPVSGAAVASGLSISDANTYYSADATTAVKSWLTGTQNNGFVITPAGVGVSASFDSKESSTTSHPATLTILLSSVGPAGPKGDTGNTGAKGDTGSRGLTGLQGPSSLTGLTTTQRLDFSLGGNDYETYALGCITPGFPNLIGGGCGHTDSNVAQEDIAINYSGPFPGQVSLWQCKLTNKSSQPRGITIYAICAK